MFFSMMILMVVMQSLYKKELPFYKDFQSNGENSIIAFVVSAGLTGIFFGLHKLIRSSIQYSFSIYIYIGILLIINIILWKKLFNISWKQSQLEDAQ